ncbi:MAG: AAA family ATPase [Chloroflexi bacterium]|nr:AAA family ATPase [Chloroflexota bacterium]
MSVLEKLAGFVARHWRGLLIWLIVVAAFFLWFLPNAETALPFLLYGAYLVFQLLFAIMFMVVQFGALFYFLSRGRTYWVMPGETGIGFKDYRGQKDVLETASRWVTLLRGVKEFKRMGGEVSRGLLLVGPPGTGKSYLAQAIATEAGVPFGYTSAASFRAMFLGMDVMTVWRLYRKARGLARKHGACILFIDELDAIGGARTSGMGGMGMMGGMFGGGGGALNQLLMEMDPPRLTEGWKDRLLRKLGLLRKPAVRPNVVTMGATNIVEVLDQALLRAGRFDRQLTIDAPDEDGRKDIIEYYLAKVRHEDMPVDRMSADTIGYTPVTIKYIVNEATVVAHFNGRDAITYQDFTEAREAHEWGIRQPIRGMKLEEKRRIAYHEAGHAFAMAMLMKETARISKATIIRYGRALGMVAPKPVEERYTETKEEILAEIQVCLASRAAEELFLGTQMSGVTSDLQQATRLAQAYLGIYGMGGSFFSFLASGNMLNGMPDKHKIEELLNEQYLRVKTLLAVHSEAMHAIAQALLTQGELIGEDIQRIIEEKERERQSQDVTTREDTRRLAYHESGHAIAQALLVRRRELGKVSIVSSSESETYNELRPFSEQQTYSREEVLAEVQVKLASRATEELFLGTVLDNSAGDLKRARDLARYVVTYMNPGDSLFIYEPEHDIARNGRNGRARAPEGDYADGKLNGESKDQHDSFELWGPNQRLQREADELLREQYEAVKRLLKENEHEVHELARALAEKGELTVDDVRRILNGKLPQRTLDAAPAAPAIAVSQSPADAGVTAASAGD